MHFQVLYDFIHKFRMMAQFGDWRRADNGTGGCMHISTACPKAATGIKNLLLLFSLPCSGCCQYNACYTKPDFDFLRSSHPPHHRQRSALLQQRPELIHRHRLAEQISLVVMTTIERQRLRENDPVGHCGGKSLQWFSSMLMVLRRCRHFEFQRRFNAG